MSLEKNENIQVFIRLKPTEKALLPKENSLTLSNHTFTFDKIFILSNQEEIYESIYPTVSYILDGYNSSIFAYGTSGSGKTYTIFGPPENPGITSRACSTIFKLLESKVETNSFEVKCSFLEIYCENVKDLMNDKSSLYTPSLRIRQDPKKGIYIQGLVEKIVYTPEEVSKIIETYTKQRSTASTKINDVSSRSHAVLILNVIQNLADGSELYSQLCIVDLAGSENVGKSEVTGQNLVEAQSINKSLNALSNVIFALSEKMNKKSTIRHIPYRDSKLTYLLQNSLGGNSKTAFIATVDSMLLSEALNTLKFAKRLKDVKTTPKVNRKENLEILVKTIEKLKEEKGDINNSNQDIEALLEDFSTLLEKQRNLCQIKSQELYKSTLKLYKTEKELEKYKVIYKGIKNILESKDKNGPEIIINLLERYPITEDVIEEEFVPVEIE